MEQKNQLIQRLRNRIRNVETERRVGAEQKVSSGCWAMDRLLPAGGLERGSLVQWITGRGSGADYLSLLAAKEACRNGGSLVVIDQANQFYPPAAAAMGLPLDRTVILRNASAKAATVHRQESLEDNDFLWSIDQSLRCPAVAAVWGAMDTIDARWFRRFQLSAESSGCLGLFVQPLTAAADPTWADVQWQVSNLSGAERSQLTLDQNEQPLRLTLSRCRGTFAGKAICLGINMVTGDVQDVSAANPPVIPHPANLSLPLGTGTFARKQDPNFHSTARVARP